jgi:cholesterol transport system auxiliary component
MIKLTRMTKHIFTILLMSSLCACITLIKEPAAITTYALQADAEPVATWPNVPWSLTIVRPNSNNFLDNNRISVRPEANTLQVYQGANWLDSLPDLVQTNLVESFENSGKIKSISRQNSGVPAEVALLLDIRKFEATYTSGQKIPTAQIQIHAKVVEYPSNRVIATKTFNSETTPSSKEIPDVVIALQQGLKSINQEIVGWTLTNGHPKNK